MTDKLRVTWTGLGDKSAGSVGEIKRMNLLGEPVLGGIDDVHITKPYDEVISIEHNVQFTEEPPKRTWLRRFKDRLIDWMER